MKDANVKPSKGARVSLDWSRLLGFDQATRIAGEEPIPRRARRVSLGSQIGGKVGTKTIKSV
jgi:hypothetical protein